MERLSSVSQVWQRNWDRITPFFHYPAEIRKAIYTTDSVEALHRSERMRVRVDRLREIADGPCPREPPRLR